MVAIWKYGSFMTSYDMTFLPAFVKILRGSREEMPKSHWRNPFVKVLLYFKCIKRHSQGLCYNWIQIWSFEKILCLSDAL